GGAGVVCALGAAAVLVGRRAPVMARRRAADGGGVPLWAVVVVAVIAAMIPDLLPVTWAGTALACAVTAGLGAALALASRRRGLGMRHVAAVGLGLLLARGLLAFTYFPLIGEVTAVAKYSHNTVMLAAVLLAGGLALRPRAVEERAL